MVEGIFFFFKSPLLILLGTSQMTYSPDSRGSPFVCSSNQDVLWVCKVHGTGDTLQTRTDSSFCLDGVRVHPCRGDKP